MRSYFEQTLLWAIALLIGLSGCSSAPALVFQSRTVQPGKQAEPAYSLSGRRHYSTWSYGAASAEDALELAYVGVLVKQVAAELGVKLEGGTEAVEREQNGIYSYRFTSRSEARRVPVQLAGVRVEDSYQECWKRSGEMQCNAYVKVSVPIAELSAAARKVRGRVALAYVCAVKHPEACGGGNLQALREAADRVGLTLIEETVEEDRPAEDLGRELDAAYVLRINIGASIIGSQKSGSKTAYYARGTGAAEFVETHLGKVLSVVRTDPMKDGGYCSEDALRHTVRGIVESLCTEIEASDIGDITAGDK